MNQNYTLLGLLVAVFIAEVGATLAIISKVLQDRFADRREQWKLVSLVRGELINIRRHCEVVENEVSYDDIIDIELERNIVWQKRKHGDLSFIKSNISKPGFIEEATVADFLQLALYIRNNDIEIDGIIDYVGTRGGDAKDFTKVLSRIKNRMNLAVGLSSALLQRPALAPQRKRDPFRWATRITKRIRMAVKEAISYPLLQKCLHIGR
jgi:hypothetical protein